MATPSAFETLNPAQRAAARHGGGPLLVIAGAGTGKTNTLAHRVAHLALGGAAPERILLLTFTRRAAEEMIRRARRIAGEARFPWAGTFHSVANRLLRVYAKRIGLEERFSVLDRGDAADLMDVVRHELGYSKVEAGARRFPRKDTCLAICSHRVNTQGTLEKTLADAFPWCAQWHDELNRLFSEYVARKLASQALDYDDLLLYWRAMMEEPALGAAIGGRFDHVLVDEYQDTNAVQAQILRLLRPAGEGLTVVGDDAQAIYSFRAATVENIRGFEKEYGAAVIALEENYRSTQAILDAANALIGKNLRSVKGQGARPRYVSVADDAGQADYVVACVLEARERGVLLRRQAVLFRSSHHSDLLELELARRNIPFVKYGGLRFLEAAHVKDLLAVLRWADNPRNRVAAFRALQIQQGVGPGIAGRIFTRFEADGFSWGSFRSGSDEFDELMSFLSDPRTPWPGQVARVREWYEPQLERLYESAQVRAGDLHQLEYLSTTFRSREKFLTELALDPPAASGDLAGAPYLDEDYLVLSTVHSAKGQEWDSVHILNVADGNFPSEFSTGKPELVEEERRLLYVAMTRAKTELHVIAPLKYYVTQQQRLGDRYVYGARSRFMTKKVLDCFEMTSWPSSKEPETEQVVSEPLSTSISARLRGMWT